MTPSAAQTGRAHEPHGGETVGSPTEEDPNLPPGKRQWWLAGLAWLLALGAFFVPQRIPLEWYPLNEPGTDIHYLEIKCASNADGWVTLWYDITHGWSDIDQIRFPISPTEQTYTYTFPLPDAPMIGLRLDSVEKGGTLSVHHMRIINRRGELVREFPVESLNPLDGIATIKSLSPGWAITADANALRATTLVEPFPPIYPVGMTGRNIHRCLLSTGYLAGMLVILMLAVTSAFWRPTGWRDFVGHICLLALIAIPFSAVGNRGLIRNTIHYATYVPGDKPVEPSLEIVLQADRSLSTQLYWDVGDGFAESLSQRRSYIRAPEPQVLRFTLPTKPLRSLRFDPDDRACIASIASIRVVGSPSVPSATVPSQSLVPVNQIAGIHPTETGVRVEAIPGSEDPYVHFGADAVDAINRAVDAIRSSNAR